MAHSAPFNLPDDLVILIATELKREGGTTTDLLNFTLVSKRWQHLGLPIFYGNITLTNTTLVRFVDSFNAGTYGGYVRSLTARFETDSGVHPETLAMFTGPHGPPLMSSEFSGGGMSTDFSGFGMSTNFTGSGMSTDFSGFGASSGSPYPASTPAKVNDMLERLVPMIPQFVDLRSFSLVVAPAPHRLIRRATIIALLDALPATCTNLELDTHAQDHREEDEKAHVCDAVRNLLPRMQHVRIRVGAMCSAMFSADQESHAPREDGATDDDLNTVTTPHLRSLVLNCGFGGPQIQLCGQNDYTSHTKHPGRPEGLALSSITKGLEQFVSQQGEALKDSRIYVMVGLGGDSAFQQCQTELREDVVTKVTWAFPVLRFGPTTSSGKYIMRLHDESEHVLSNEDQIEALSEDFVWKNDIGGARLPAEALDAERDRLPSFATGCVESRLPAQTGKQWAAAHPNVALNTVWRNEEMVGQRMVFAEKRIGNDYSGPIREITPAGWNRTRDGHGVKRA